MKWLGTHDLRPKTGPAALFLILAAAVVVAYGIGGIVPLVAAAFALVPYFYLKRRIRAVRYVAALISLCFFISAFAGSPTSMNFHWCDLYVPSLFDYLPETTFTRMLGWIGGATYSLGNVPLDIISELSSDFFVTCTYRNSYEIQTAWFVYFWGLFFVSCLCSILAGRRDEKSPDTHGQLATAGTPPAS